MCVCACVHRRPGSCNIQQTPEPLGATGLPCAGIEVSALISPGDCQSKDSRHNHFTASNLLFLLSLPPLLIFLQALSIFLSSLLSLFLSTLSSLLYFYPTATWLSPRCHVLLSFSFCRLFFFNFPAIISPSPSLWLSLRPAHISSSSSPCSLSWPCVCLFALSVAELARLSQFLHLILREMTMLQSAAIISQIKALKLNLARLKT